MDSCDILIVGGGPAGSTLAWKLGAAGVDVAILDRKTFPRDKTCAGWITPAVIDTLQLDAAHYAAGRVFQPIRRFVTGMIGGTEVHTEYSTPVSFGIRRFEFDDYLIRRCGARLMLGGPLSILRRNRHGWVVNGRLRASLVVGAGGHFCPVARQLGASLVVADQVVAAQEIEFEMTAAQQRACRVEGERPELYFCDDLKGYGWAIRKGNFLNIGLGREDGHHLPERVAAFCDRLKREGRVPSDMPTGFHGHAYLLYPHALRPLVADRALLIGDAAGLADAQSGEGILPAVASACGAAAAIIAARGDYRRERLGAYADLLTERFGRRRRNAGPPPASDPPRVRRALAHWLMRRAWFARHVVIERWFLHRHQRPLAA